MSTINTTVHDAGRIGLDLTTNKTTVNTSNTYQFPNDGRVKMFVNNITNTNCVATIVTPNTVDGLAVTDRTVTVGTLKAFVVGPFPPDIYNNDSGYVAMTFDQAVEITAFRG